MPFTIDELTDLKTLAVVAMNQAYRDAATKAGEDFLSALRIDGERAQPCLGEAATQKLDHAHELRDLHTRVGIELDDTLVAADPDRKLYPAAHARVRDRKAAADPEVF
jgi:hypothetical protein